MSLNVGFDTGMKSLLAAQAALQTIGNNIANANTPGFSRETILLGATSPVTVGGLSLGTGVNITEIRRMVDESLEQRLLLQRGGFARYQVEHAGYQELENIFTGAGGNGLSAGLGAIFTNLGSLATHPDDKASRKSTLTGANDFANSLRELASRLSAFKGDRRSEASLRVGNANEIASEIAVLNEQIVTLKSRGISSHALLDRRQQLLGELSQNLEVTTLADPNGAVRVFVGGYTIVTGNKHFELALENDAQQQPILRIKGGVGEIATGSGAVAGLLRLSEQAVPELQSKADQFTKALILAFNRVHSTGVPPSGGFEYLQGVEAPSGGAAAASLALSAAGYSTTITKGDLFINVQDTKTGEVTQTQIAIDPSDSLNDFASSISQIPNLSATIDAAGKLRISATTGFKFDFSPRLDPNPASSGGFGGMSGAVTSANKETFTLTAGSNLQIAVDGAGPQTVTFSSGQFSDMNNATADEVAAAINSQLTGATAVVDHGVVTIVSDTTGQVSSIEILASSTANSSFGFGTTADTGSAASANVTISGTFSGATNDQWTFKADSDGQIGVTPNLTIGVFDSQGNRISTLSVGEGYSPGTKLAVKDGVQVTFGPAEISSSSNDSFTLNVIANSDSSDVLSALGLNTFFSGNSAANISVREDLLSYPELLATSITGAPADGGNVNRLLQIQKADQLLLNGVSLPGYLTEVTTDLALDTKRSGDLETAQEILVNDLSARREEVSGVSLEEEMANLVRFQQAFGAAGRYMRVLQDTSSSLLDLIR
ncbi:MAG: flagellar hook-associated protein FlgK [Planctomycetota bacterium]